MLHSLTLIVKRHNFYECLTIVLKARSPSQLLGGNIGMKLDLDPVEMPTILFIGQ